MPAPSPLRNLHAQAEAEFAPHPPAGSVYAAGADAAEVVATFGDLNAERAAVESGAGLLDRAERACVTVTGADRLDLLDRLLTQTLRDLPPGRWAPAFLLNRQGRIVADLRVIALEGRVLIETHAVVAGAAGAAIEAGVFLDDVTVEPPDAGEPLAGLSLVGPGAARAYEAATGGDAPPGERHARRVRVADADTVALLDESLGAGALTLLAPAGALHDVYERLLETPGVRAIGWRAADEARVRARAPMHLIDFGAASLPHETGVLRDRVSFSKGCYPGQEIVARMESRGRAKQVLVALRADGAETLEVGAPIRRTDQSDAEAVGVVTSSAPAREDRPAEALAVVRTAHATVGARLDAGPAVTVAHVLGAEA
ncbi:MAG: hypothetical protein D6693_04455 [Planctomycetota bacterium]|nr:MAG: hypothetical protein D6693_04455 [Planctomycetota bacterium]